MGTPSVLEEVLNNLSPTASETDDEQTQTPFPTTESELTQTEFHVTGFKQFYNVAVNPTELIVQALPAFLEQCPLPPSACIASTNVFTVAAKTTLSEIKIMYAQHAENKKKKKKKLDNIQLEQLSSLHHHYQQQSTTTTKTGNKNNMTKQKNPKTVFIHLGVNMTISNFCLEMQAKNEATFSCPDELGWTPIRHAIDPDDSDITLTRRTTLDVPKLTDQLRSRDFDVDISFDAGRFVCNWIYYNSLKLSKENDTQALFVHVPSTASIPLQEQVQFVAALMDCIASH